MRLGTVGDKFLCRTMKAGTYPLNDPTLLAAIRSLKPVVFLDTAIRFSTAKDEDSATENRQLANGLFGMLNAGARAVIGNHHAVKSSRNDRILTLETALRGTGDIGAVCDTVWALKCFDEDTVRITLNCVKHRDFEPPAPFDIIGRPHIDETGDFALAEGPSGSSRDEIDKFRKAVQANSKAKYREIHEDTGISTGRIKKVAELAGYQKIGGTWGLFSGTASQSGVQFSLPVQRSPL